MQKLVVFILIYATSGQLEKKIKKTVPFTMASNSILNVTDLYTENYKTLLEEI